MKQWTIEELSLGQKASVKKTITEALVLDFARVTGDFNPQHVDETFAKQSIFKERIAHGILSVGMISQLLGTELPGMGSIYLSQEVKFLAPVKFNDVVEAFVEVVKIEEKKVKLRTYCLNQDGTLILDGYAEIKPTKKK